jgi:hypothetical protein
MNKINQVVIWGHKLHSHTHSYIHNGFFIAFNYLGYKTLWFDDHDNVRNIDFSNTLFITEHQVNKKIPLRNDSLYLTHYVDEGDYKNIPKENIIILKVSLRDFKEKDSLNTQYITLNYGQKFEYHAKIDNYNCLYMYWATDLLPEEIDKNILTINDISPSNEINFIGSMTNIWNVFSSICRINNIKFNNYGATFNINSDRNISTNHNILLTKKSLIAPALQDNGQIFNNYIPCRIFKNISYGKMGITNNPIVNELFDKKLIFDTDIYKLIKKSVSFENYTHKNDVVIDLMKHVRDNHTYINRANTIIKYINEYTNFKI